MPNPLPIVIDTDPGQDDALAILLALALPERFDVRAIIAVAGNVPVVQTAANARRITELAGHPELPVYAGCAAPMMLPLVTAEFVCGPDGLAGAELPPPATPLATGHGVTALLELLRASPPEGLTICALGPLTNIAMALRLAPELADRIASIVVMGGALALGNITPAAEYNFYADPHAAAVVLNAGRPVTLLGLHATHQAIATPDTLEQLAAMGTQTGRAIHGMLTRPRASGLGTTGHPVHDACVIGTLAWPDLFQGRDCSVEIDTSDGKLRGRSTIDWHGRLRLSPNAHVIDQIDAPGFFARSIAALRHLP
jgi:purine nucleosidase